MKQQQKSSKEIKADKVNTLAEKIKKAKSLTFTDYHGLAANQIAQLRSKIKQSGGELIVEKNNLIKRALTNNQLPETHGQLVGPTAAIMAYDDELAPIKELAESKKTLGFPSFKFGFFNRKQIDSQALEQLALIPSKNTLQANLVGTLASPITSFHYVLSANIRNLISILGQKASQSG